MTTSNQAAMNPVTPVAPAPESLLRKHAPFLVAMLIYVLFSLFTIRDFPTVDKTIDDMWNLEWATTLLQEGRSHQVVNLLPALNEIVVPFNWNIVTSAFVYENIERSIFAIRVKNMLFGVALLVLLYGFSSRFFQSEMMGVATVIAVGFTNAFLYRSHDARADILTALMFFLIFMTSYRIVFSDPPRLSALFWFPFIILFTFRHVHPNGVILGSAAAATILTMRFSLVKVPKVWGALACGLGAYVVYDVIVRLIAAQLFPPAATAAAPASSAAQYKFDDFLIMLPIWNVIQEYGTHVVKSFYHVIGLILKFPVRMLTRIDRQTMTAFVDLALMGLAIVAFIARRFLVGKSPRSYRFMVILLVYYLIAFSFLGASTNDYTVYIMPIVVMLLFASIRDIGVARSFSWRPVVYGLVGVEVAVIVALLMNIKFGHRYYDSYVQLDSGLSRVIPAKSTVIGGAVYFTMLRPNKEMEFYEIFRSAGPIMRMEEHYFTEVGYNFAQEFLKKRFDYVIYDDFFEAITRRVGFGKGTKKTFSDSLLGGYEPIWHSAANYPSNKALIRNVTVYRLKAADSAAVPASAVVVPQAASRVRS